MPWTVVFFAHADRDDLEICTKYIHGTTMQELSVHTIGSGFTLQKSAMPFCGFYPMGDLGTFSRHLTLTLVEAKISAIAISPLSHKPRRAICFLKIFVAS